MAQNGYRRREANAKTHTIPSIGKVMGQGGFDEGNPGKPPRIREVMKQNGGADYDKEIPTIQRALRQGGGSVK